MEQLRVNSGVAGLYSEASFGSEMVSQVLLWEKLILLGRKKDFLFVRAEDGYQGWINENQVVYFDDNSDLGWKTITQLRGSIFTEQNFQSEAICDFSIGTSIPLISNADEWSEVLMPDNRKGWMKKEFLTDLPRTNRDDFLKNINRFLGLSYLWGGKSGYGVDCSGFTQLSHKLFGIDIRRDAWMQYEDARPVSEDINKANPADLYFFSEDRDKITHVGIALGEGMLMHSRGYVRRNSILPEHELFDEKLTEQFVGIKTFFIDGLTPLDNE